MVKWAIVSTILLIATAGAVFFVVRQPADNKENGGYFGDKVEQFCVGQSCIDNKSGRYTINGIPAGDEMVTTYLTKLSELTIGEIVSNNRDNFADFGIGVSTVTLSANGKELEIGNINSSYNATFVHIPGTEYVNVVEMVMDKKHLADPKTWENRTITNLALPDITKIVRSENGKEIEIKTTDVNFRQTLAALTPEEYLNEFVPAGAKEIIYKIETKYGTIDLRIGKDKFAYATIDGNDYYRIADKTWGVLTRNYK